MSDSQLNGSQSSSISPLTCVVDACELFEVEWRDGHCPRIEAYLETAPSRPARAHWLGSFSRSRSSFASSTARTRLPLNSARDTPNGAMRSRLAFEQGRSAQAGGAAGRAADATRAQQLDRSPFDPARASDSSRIPEDVTVGSVCSPDSAAERVPIEPVPARLRAIRSHESARNRRVRHRLPGARRRALAAGGDQGAACGVVAIAGAGRVVSWPRHETRPVCAIRRSWRCTTSAAFGDFGVFVVFEYVEGRNLAELLRRRAVVANADRDAA